MPGLDSSVEGARQRAQQDFDEMKRQVQVIADASTAKDAIIDEMATTHTSDTSAIDALKAERDALNVEIADAQAKLDAFDLDTSFPPAPTEPPVEVPPVGDTGGGVNPPPPPTGGDIPVGTGAGDVGGAPPPPPEVTNPPEPTVGDGTATPAPVDTGVSPEGNPNP